MAMVGDAGRFRPELPDKVGATVRNQNLDQ